MPNKARYIVNPFIILTLFTLLISSCNKEKSGKNIDEELYEMAQETAGFTWYKKTDELLDKSAGSGHSQPFLRTRYNAVAASVLDDDGRVISGTTFPEDALIVKELYSDATTLDRYAMLYKKPDHRYADGKGWVWGYVEANGDIASPASKKGGSCIDCHSQSGNIDYMLMNKFFP